MLAGEPQTYAARHFRWNFGVLQFEAVAFFIGLAFFDGGTVVPILMRRLGADDMLIGLGRMVQVLGYTLPALFAAHYIHGRRRHKSFLITVCAIGRTGLLTVPIVLYLFGAARPGLALGWMFVVIGLFWLLDGACAVSWFDIVAKAIHGRVRGRFFGLMQTLGGIGAVCAGLAVQRILAAGGPSFPGNFALLAAVWGVGAIISQVGLMLLREPEGLERAHDDRPGFMGYIGGAWPLLRRRPQLLRIIFLRIALDGAGMAGPFYALFAVSDLHQPVQVLGLYITIQSAGKILTGPFWGWITDHLGPTVGVRCVAVAVMAAPAIALVSAHAGAWALPIVFFLIGSTQEGAWMVISNAILASVTEEERPLAVGVSSACQTPSAIYGVLGGLIASSASYRMAFAASAALAGLGALLAFRMPRTADPPG